MNLHAPVNTPLCIWNTHNSWLAPSRVGGIDGENSKHQMTHPLGLSSVCIRCERGWRRSCFLNCSRICTTWGNTKMGIYKVGRPMDTVLDNWQLSFNVKKVKFSIGMGTRWFPSIEGEPNRTYPCERFLIQTKTLCLCGDWLNLNSVLRAWRSMGQILTALLQLL